MPPSPLNSTADIPRAISRHQLFPEKYYIILRDNARPIIHAALKCLIAMGPLVWESLDESCKQKIIAQVTEPTDWMFLLTSPRKENRKLWICLDPKDIIAATSHDH